MKNIKKINVKASCRFAEIKTKTVLSSLESIVASDTTDSIDEIHAPILIWNLRSILSINTLSVLIELSLQTTNSVQEIVPLNTTCTVSSWWVEWVTSWAHVETILVVISPLSDSTGWDRDAKSVVKFIFFRGAVKTLSGFSVKVSTSWAHIMAVVIDQNLSRFALFLEHTFSSIHEEIVSNTLCAGSSILVVNLAEFIHFMTEVVVTQVLSWWAWVWLFNLKTDSVWLKSVGWNTGQTWSSCIKLITKVTHFCALSEIVWNESGRANNFDAFGLGSIEFISPNAFNTFSSELFESLTKWVSINTFQESIDELLISADLINWGAFSSDWLFDWAETGCTDSRISNPFFAFVIDFIASPGGFVEEGSSSAGQRGFFTETIIECVSRGAFGAFGEIIVSVTSERVGEALTILFVLSGRAILLDTSCSIKDVSSVAGFTSSDNWIIEDTWKSGEVSLEETTSVDIETVGVFRDEGTCVDFSEVIHSEVECSGGCPINSCSSSIGCSRWGKESWSIDSNPSVVPINFESPSDCTSGSCAGLSWICSSFFGDLSQYGGGWIFTEDSDSVGNCNSGWRISSGSSLHIHASLNVVGVG